jgi:CYTH domain-containing protein
MNTEIERKFLASQLPSDPGLGKAVRQGYLTPARETRTTVRVRLVDNLHGFLTIKSGLDLSRVEVELPLKLTSSKRCGR